MKYTLAPPDFNRWQELHRLLINSFAYMDAVIDPPSSMNQLTPEGLRAKSQSECLLMVCDGSKLVACAFFEIRPKAIYVSKIAVSKTHRRRGITRKIFEFATDFARQREKPFLELQTRIELVQNHKVFAALGFVKTSEDSHDGYDRATSITMQRSV